MSKMRIVVEWCFKEVPQLFTALDFTRTQRILVSPIGLQYFVAVLLYNTHVCLHNPQIPQYFAQNNHLNLPFPLDESQAENLSQLLTPPSLEEYFHFENYANNVFLFICLLQKHFYLITILPHKYKFYPSPYLPTPDEPDLKELCKQEFINLHLDAVGENTRSTDQIC